MKKVSGLIVVFLLLFSCAKKPVNGKLDGRWQLMEVAWKDHVEWGPELVYPDFTYYDFQLELVRLAITGGDEYKTRSIWGRFVYTEDSLHIRAIGKKRNDVFVFGMSDTIEHFGIEEITRKRMVLNSEFAHLVFRKF